MFLCTPIIYLNNDSKSFSLHLCIYFQVCVQEYSSNVCDNLYNVSNKEALDNVQTGSSHWILGSTLMLAVPSILTAQFLGSWSDTYGRKLPLLLPPIGKIYLYLEMCIAM